MRFEKCIYLGYQEYNQDVEYFHHFQNAYLSLFQSLSSSYLLLQAENLFSVPID